MMRTESLKMLTIDNMIQDMRKDKDYKMNSTESANHNIFKMLFILQNPGTDSKEVSNPFAQVLST